MTYIKSVSPQRKLPCLNLFVKKTQNILSVSVFLLFVALLGINSANAQSGERLSSEKEESQGSALTMPGDVDSSFVANLFTTLGQGSRASVSALARQNDGKILVAGNFSFVNGVPKALFVRLNRDGSVDTRFNPLISFPIQKIMPLADGKILVSGNFSITVNGINYRGLARLNEDGSLDDGFAVDASGVSEFAVQPDEKIVIVGGFSQVNGFSINRVARLNTDGSLDTSFQIGNGADNSASAVAIQPDGKILIGGNFTTFNSAALPRLVRLNTDGSLDKCFNACTGTSNTSGPSNSVTQIILQPDNKILIGGIFTAVNGVARSAGIARLENNGTLDSSFAPTTPLSNTSGVRLALQIDGKILAGFSASFPFGTTSSTTLYRFNSDGSLDNTFSSIVNSAILAILLEDDGKIIIGGAFTQVNGVFKSTLARLNPSGMTDNGFNYTFGFSASANTIAVQADGKILVAGNFEYVNETVKSGLVRLNADGSVDESFKATGNFFNVTGSFGLFAVVPQPDGKVLIGGNFTIVNGQTVNRIARLKSDGSLDTDFNVGNGTNGTVTSIVRQADGKILVAGDFNTFNGASRPRIARLNQDGTIDTTFDSPFAQNGLSISTMTLQADGKILVGGVNFTLLNGTVRRSVIRLNSNGSVDESFSSLAESTIIITVIAMQPDGKILIGGAFSLINGVVRRSIARLNADGSVDATFNPRSGANNSVNAILLQTDGKIIIGGNFTTFNGIRRNRLARLNPNGSLDDFNAGSGANGQVLTLAMQSAGRLLIGGNFTQIGGLNRVGLARLRLSQFGFAPLFDFDGDGKTDFAVFRPDSGAWYRLNSSNGSFDGRLFGLSSDRLVPGDYDGDGKTDIAVWRPSSGEWIILKSTTNEVSFQQFGTNGDRPLAADYDGDGRDDLAVFRPSNGTWYILGSTSGFQAVQFGVSTDVPLIGDFDGDGKADVAVFRPSNGTWYVLPSLGGFTAVQFGINEDVPVAADYDGDGKTDIAVWRPSNATWYLLRSAQGFTSTQFGNSPDRPAPGDYDGDGKADIAVFRPSNGTWYVILSSNNAAKTQVFGLSGDVPIPAAYLR